MRVSSHRWTALFGATLVAFAFQACSGSREASDDDDDGRRAGGAGEAGEGSGGTIDTGGSGGRGQSTGGVGGTSSGGGGGEGGEGSADGSAGSDESGGTGGSSGGAGGSGRSGGSGGSSGGTGGETGGGTGGDSAGSGASGTSAGSGGAGGSSGAGGGTSGWGGASGGDAGGGSAGASAGASGACSSCQPGSTASSILIQNFEDNSAQVLAHGSRYGTFTTYVTGTSTIDPAPDTVMTPECTGANGNCYRLCASGVVNGSDYPVAAIAVDLAGKTPYDLSAYSGVSFSLSGQISSGTRLDFHVSTMATTDTMYGGSCTGIGLPCQDHHSKVISLTPQTVHFYELAQGGWGTPAAWNAAQVLEFHWQVTSIASTAVSQTFTICIDDISLAL